jgi:hypothetical protein
MISKLQHVKQCLLLKIAGMPHASLQGFDQIEKAKMQKKNILTHRKQDGNVTQSRETWIDVCVVFFKQRRICNNRGEVAAPIWRQYIHRHLSVRQ